MIDHLELQTHNLDACAAFYGDVLGPLGYALKLAGPAKGYGDGTGLDLFIVEGEPSANVHFAFVAPDRATVDLIYARALTAGWSLDRAPALAPRVHPNYYAGYLRDPDGRLVEFVCQRPE